MADWDEVKRLAADFQKVQLTSSVQKLSERNCIEIVSMLIQKKLIDLIFTTDGKEYMTPTHLISDIKGELYDNGGRVNLTNIAKTIGVDLSHIMAHTKDVLKGQKDIHLILGQLIDGSYVKRIAGEINEKLVQQGQVNISDLTMQYDLPAEFLQQQVVEKNMGKFIFGQQDKNDPRIFFTESFVARSKAKMRGALAGLTKPTPVTVLLNHTGVSEKLFFSLFDQASAYGVLTSRVAGSMYVPHIYSRNQHEWTTNFFKQNNYLEYDTLVRLGITDYKTYLRKQYPSKTVFLNSCMISETLVERLEADIEEAIISRSYLDLQASLPSVVSDEDIKMILDMVLKQQKQRETIVLGNIVISQALIDRLMSECEPILKDHVESVVTSGQYQKYQTDLQLLQSSRQSHGGSARGGGGDDDMVKGDKREERRKKATGGKSGGGTQGRETKTKSTKKGGGRQRGKQDDDDSDNEQSTADKKPTLQFLSLSDLTETILPILEEEGLETLAVDICQSHLSPKLNAKGLEIASKLYQATVSDRSASRRETHNDIQTKLNVLLGDVRLFDKGVKQLTAETQPTLYKYLLKTLCTDIVNEIIGYLSAEEGNPVDASNFTIEQRTKYINDLSQEYKQPMQALLKSLSLAILDDFNNSIESALASCSMIIKKVDKKKDRLLILNHKHGLLDQLSICNDPAFALHLTTLVLFVTVTQCMVHASGRHVAILLTFLKPSLSADVYIELMNYHDKVMLSTNQGTEEIKDGLQESMQKIKQIANDFKKSSSAAEKS